MEAVGVEIISQAGVKIQGERQHRRAGERDDEPEGIADQAQLRIEICPQDQPHA